MSAISSCIWFSVLLFVVFFFPCRKPLGNIYNCKLIRLRDFAETPLLLSLVRQEIGFGWAFDSSTFQESPCLQPEGGFRRRALNQGLRDPNQREGNLKYFSTDSQAPDKTSQCHWYFCVSHKISHKAQTCHCFCHLTFSLEVFVVWAFHSWDFRICNCLTAPTSGKVRANN